MEGEHRSGVANRVRQFTGSGHEKPPETPHMCRTHAERFRGLYSNMGRTELN